MQHGRRPTDTQHCRLPPIASDLSVRPCSRLIVGPSDMALPLYCTGSCRDLRLRSDQRMDVLR